MAANKDTRQEIENEILDFLYKMKDSETQPFVNASDPEFMQMLLQFWSKVWEQSSSMPEIIDRIRTQENPENVLPVLRKIFIDGAMAAYMIDYMRVNKQFAKDPETEKRIKSKLAELTERLNKNETEQTAAGTDPSADQIPEHLRGDKAAAALLKKK